jgi:primase-polymerase (primpol)-like protein
MLAWFGTGDAGKQAQGTQGSFLGEFGSWDKCQEAKETINKRLSKNSYAAYAMCFAK